MFIPPQGVRHAATLLLTNAARAVPAGASPEEIQAALDTLAHELVDLAGDMRAPPAASPWLIAEIHTTIDRLPHTFDRESAKSRAADVVARVASRTSHISPRDLFLVYRPEDRLSVAAPMAVELMKRRVSVAFAEYEVATAQQFTAAVDHGLSLHRAGVVLWTDAFDRARWAPVSRSNERIRILQRFEGDTTVQDLVNWIAQLRMS